jgi:hypothetical protein
MKTNPPNYNKHSNKKQAKKIQYNFKEILPTFYNDCAIGRMSIDEEHTMYVTIW